MNHSRTWIAIFVCVIFATGRFAPAKADTHVANVVDWHSDGTVIAVGYADGAIDILNASTGQTINTFTVPGQISLIRWHPTEKKLAGFSGIGENETIWTLDVQTGRYLEGLSGEFNVPELDWSPSGNTLASLDFIGGGSQNLIHLWHVTADGFATYQALDNQLGFTSLDWNPVNERWIALGAPDGTLAIWDTQANTLAWTGGEMINDPDAATTLDSVSWSPDGSKFAAADSSSKIDIWDWNGTSATLSQSFSDNTQTHFGTAIVRWSPDGQKLAIAQPASVRVIDAETGSPLTETEQLAFLRGFAWGPDSAKLVYIGETQSGGTNQNVIQTFTPPELQPSPTPTANPASFSSI